MGRNVGGFESRPVSKAEPNAKGHAMVGQTLRPYQKRGMAEITAAIAAGSNRVLAVAPTGSGKTSMFSTFAKQCASYGILILVHRRELATQAAARLKEFGTDFGYIMADEPPKPSAAIQIASVQTLVKRIKKGVKPVAKYIICDEAHLSTAETWQTILVEYPNAVVLGFTATPWRLGGAPLAGAYESCVVVSTPAQLCREGHLCEYQGFSYLAPDLSKVKTVQGDFNQKQSGEAMRAPQIVANIVEQWQAHAAHLSTVVFAVTVDHSKALAAEFVAAGARAEHLDGTASIEQRKAILARVESGATQVLCNVGVAVEGLDIPRLKCCILARPTKSLARAIQMMGRVRRVWRDPATGQNVTARIHDHAFNIRRHGLPDADRDYNLDSTPEDPPSLTTCTKCFAVFEPTGKDRSCPMCGPQEREPGATGERQELATIDDAEIFEFASGQGPMPARVDPYLAPVAISWGSTTPGRVFEGVYEEVIDEKTDYGPRKRYTVRGEKRTYHLFGAARLNTRMAGVKIGSLVRITYKGQEITGHKRAHEFTVEADDTEGESKAALIEQGRVMYVDKRMAFREIGEALGVSKGGVAYWAKQYGWPVRTSTEQRATDPAIVEQGRVMYAGGAPFEAVGEAVGVSKAAVQKWAKKGGWPVRRVGRAKAAACRQCGGLIAEKTERAGRTYCSSQCKKDSNRDNQRAVRLAAANEPAFPNA